MIKTSFGQKFLLVAFGCVIALISLEAVLRLGGFLFSLRQEARNKVSFASGEIRILCIGESTTALGNDNAYPAQLEEILNKRAGESRFKVINKGLVSKSSRDILEQLDGNLRRYRPQIVVAMIGINDTKDTPGFFSKGAWDRFISQWRVYHLFVLLRQHIDRAGLERRLGSYHKVGENTPATPGELERSGQEIQDKDYPKIVAAVQSAESSLVGIQAAATATQDQKQRDFLLERAAMIQYVRAQNYRLLGIYHRLRQEYRASEAMFTAALGIAPSDALTKFELARLLREEKRYPEALAVLLNVLAKSGEDPGVYLEYGRVLSGMGEQQGAREAFLQVLESPSVDAWTGLELGHWFKEHGYYKEAERALTRAYQMNALDYGTMEDLADVSAQLGQKDRATALRKEAGFLRGKLTGYSIETVRNYTEILHRVQASGAVLVAMQYPLRDVKPLQEMLSHNPGVIFVENRDNFRSALKTAGFAQYFSDNFAGDFGHCRPAGNRLIAQHLADVLWGGVIEAQK